MSSSHRAEAGSWEIPYCDSHYFFSCKIQVYLGRVPRKGLDGGSTPECLGQRYLLTSKEVLRSDIKDITPSIAWVVINQALTIAASAHASAILDLSPSVSWLNSWSYALLFENGFIFAYTWQEFTNAT